MVIDRVPFVDLGRQFKALENRLCEGFVAIGRSGQFILGEQVEAFEERVARYCGTRYAVSCANGSDALFLSLKALSISADDEVIIPVNSFIATAWVVVATGATPRFVDVGYDMNIDVNALDRAFTAKTRAIIPVHLTGRPAAMAEVMSFAQSRGLLVIEDAAQAIGASLRGKRVGGFGVAAGFSLHPLKNLGVLGDGGFITTSDAGLNERLIKLRNHGLRDRNHCELWGYNSRLDAIQAFIACEKLNHLDDWNNRCREIADQYRLGLEGLVEVPKDRQGEYCVYHNFVIRTPRRDELRDHLALLNIGTNVHYPIPLHLQEAAATLGHVMGDFPQAERFAQTMLSLPIFPELSDAEVQYVIQGVQSFFNRTALDRS